jgi:hypothetical protein
MSRALGNQLPAPLLTLLDGRDVAQKTGLAILLASVDAGGHPHFALLSVGEVLAVGPTALRLALYAESSTSANLRRGGRLSLALAAGGLAYYVKGTARERPAPSPDLPGQAVFDVVVDAVLEDGEAVARVSSGFTIALADDPARVVAYWERGIAGLAALS